MLREALAVAVEGVCILVMLISCVDAGQRGEASHEDVLIGMHFLHERADCNVTGEGAVNIAPSFWDYVQYMPEDLRHMSYADFWHWWYEFERYKGDEKGLAAMDRIVDECLRRGMKVKVDLAWSTWWTDNLDLEKNQRLNIGPVDLDDWVHLCDLLARRYKGRIALWMLQGEANNLEQYWQGNSMEFVNQVYRLGSRAFKRIDPDVMISIAGASPSVPREALDDWVRNHVNACRGTFDDVPMNYFADCADPYHGLANYYTSIRQILDEADQKDVEIGSGESSVQWAETVYTMTVPPPTSFDGQDPEKAPLSELKQAWRLNQALGDFYTLGGNKWVMWGTEYAPGGGWAWRWGMRKYQDWWGNFAADHKVEGTNIVYRYDNPDGRNVDLRQGWSSAPGDPFHPMWQVYTFWAQACPPAAEAVRIPMDAGTLPDGTPRMSTYLQGRDECVALLSSGNPLASALSFDVKRAGWPEGMPVSATVRTETIDYASGARRTVHEVTRAVTVAKRRVLLNLKTPAGFTTVKLVPADGLRCELVRQLGPETIQPGEAANVTLAVKNTGRKAWDPRDVTLRQADGGGKRFPLREKVRPGETALIQVKLPERDAPGRFTASFRLHTGTRAFGSALAVSLDVIDSHAPRKLVAHRELGHIRLKWFAPLKETSPAAYRLYRADGFEKPAKLLTETAATAYVDRDAGKDRAYYYFVTAVDGKGRESAASNEDNARAISKARLFDGEVTAESVPGRMKLGESHPFAVTIKNTGSRQWNLARLDGKSYVYLQPMQQWGNQDEKTLPEIPIPAPSGVLKSGQSVTVRIPYTALRAGRFENHWSLVIEPAEKGQRACFGTPLLVETFAE